MFIVEPQPQTVALGSQAVFNCTVVGHMGSPLFTMNGQYVSKETAEGRNGSLTNVNWTNCNKTIIFRLPGLAEYNNTEIVCIILSNSGNTVPSDTVLLRVQGNVTAHTSVLYKIIHYSMQVLLSMLVTYLFIINMKIHTPSHGLHLSHLKEFRLCIISRSLIETMEHGLG